MIRFVICTPPRSHWVVAALLSSLLAFPVDAEIGEISIGAINDKGAGWSFEINVEGSNLVSASVDIPGSSARSENLSGGSVDLVYDDTNGPFASLNDLFQRNPLGDYVFSVTDNTGTKTVTLTWDSLIPMNATGGEPSLTIVFPSPGSTIGCDGPDINYVTDCSNCTALDWEFFDVPTDGGAISNGGLLFGPFPFPIPYELSTQGDNVTPAGPLPNDPYELELIAGFIEETPSDFTGGGSDPFNFFEELSVADTVEFDVSAGTQDVFELFLGAFRQNGIWSLEAEVDGSNLCSARLDPPMGGDPIYLTTPDGSEFDFEEAVSDTFSGLVAAFPTGSWGLTVNQDSNATVVWNPLQLTGATGEPSLSVTSPVDQSVTEDTTPDIFYTLDCTNCTQFEAVIFDQATDGDTLEYNVISELPFPASPVLFSSLLDGGGPVSPLPPDVYEAEMLAGDETFSDEQLVGPGVADDFQYGAESVVDDFSVFTVPEPGSAVSLLTVLGTIAGLSRRRFCRSAHLRGA